MVIRPIEETDGRKHVRKARMLVREGEGPDAPRWILPPQVNGVE
ncbi:hypothetical protein ACFH04_07275 [Streptomyces noboritoensis]|uniref:Transposase n=1 Tax=Streptomyces noboritoensis TaxID=67337 RepID=A0ABV6TCM0_9ACTN